MTSRQNRKYGLKGSCRPFTILSFVMAMIFTTSEAVGEGQSIRGINAYGRRYVYLRDVARYYGMNLSVWKESCVLNSKYSTITFYYDKRKGTLNDVVVHYHFAPFKKGYEPFISEKDLFLVLDPVLRHQALEPHTMRTILVDPGHGGKDHGAIGSCYREKDLSLQIAKRLKKYLTQYGYYVIMSRHNDNDLSLSDRTKLCDDKKADLFVSVHCNAAANQSASGLETFCVTPEGAPSSADSKPSGKREKGNQFDKNNCRLAYEVQKRLVELTGSMDRGVKHARFYVIRNVSCPAILVEAGFISNSNEERLLGNANYQERLAKAIADGILLYHKQLLRK